MPAPVEVRLVVIYVPWMPDSVFGSVGDGVVARWTEGFEEQARALIDGGVDALHVETMSDLREANAALEAVHRVSTAIPVWVPFDSASIDFL